jgi:Tfp pilus assembly protein PilX
MRYAHRIASFQGGPSRQKGMIATLIALVVLVVTLIAVVALMHSVDSANTVAGSMSFRQAVLQEAERAYTEAKALSVYSPPGSDTDGTAQSGYFAEVQPASTVRKDLPDAIYNLDINKVHTLVLGTVDNGNNVYYMIERLCPAGGAATLTTCIVPGKALTGGTSSNTTSDPGIPFNTTGSAAAYRLTVRVNGPKNAVAFVQTIMR